MACFVFLLLSLVSLMGPAWGTPLDDYVNKPDSSYKFVDLNIPVKMDNYTVHFINMTSQTWLSTDIVSCSVWWHIMAISIPDQLTFKDTAFLYVTGGDNNNHIPMVTDEDVLFSSVMSFSIGAVAATLFQIPNQPCVFSEDTLQKRRTEDAVIAFTWYHFVNDPTKPEYLLRLPMTKAVVRAMDTITTFVKSKKPEIEIIKFAVAGASKRGWTTWTTGAVVPDRVIAMIPIVEDALNLHANLHHMYRAYGGWTFAFDDYMAMNFTARLDDPNTQAMFDIVDPYAYRERMTMPKLVINAGGDEFFLPDDNHYFWDDIPSPKYLRMVPNAEHSLVNRVTSVLLGVRAFLLGVMTNASMPKLNWTLKDNPDSEGTITLTADRKPSEVKILHATTISSTRRDFRLLTGPDPKHPTPQAVIWFGEVLSPQADGSYQYTMEKPDEGWTAFFIQALFPGPNDSVYELTTQVKIVPDIFPYPDCSGATCRGKLV